MKIIYLEPDEEITSVIDRLTQTQDNEIILGVPKGAQICQSLVNLKLLKREADNLGKNIIFVASDEQARQLAPKADFIVKDNFEQVGFNPAGKEFGTEPSAVPDIALSGLKITAQNQENGKDILDALVEELEPISYQEQKAEQRIRLAGARRMVDIVGPPKKTKFKFMPKFFKKGARVGQDLFKRGIKFGPDKTFEDSVRPAADTIIFHRQIFIYIFIGLTLTVAVLVAYLVLPRAKIVISPKTETADLNLAVTGSKDVLQIDQASNSIPIQLARIEKTLSKEFPASGEKQLAEKAKGIITVYNGYSSSPQTLVATTRFVLDDGKLFRAIKAVVVPGAKIEEGKIIHSSVEVEVAADQPGQAYNIGPSNFTIPGFKGTAKETGFYGRSKTPMAGGATGKAKVVSSDDLEKAEELLTEEVKTEVKRVFEEQRPSDLKLIKGAFREKITKISSNPGLEAQAERFVLEISAVAEGLLFKEEDLRNLADLNLAAQISQNKQPLSETQQLVIDEPVIDWDEIKVSFNAHIQEQVIWLVDTDDLSENLAGKDEIEVRKYLAGQPEIEKANVSFWPFWVKHMPLENNKIKIRVGPAPIKD